MLEGYKFEKVEKENCLTKKELEIFEILAIPYVEPKDR